MLKQPVVGFDVSNSQTMSSGSTIPFNRIKTNLGNGWSSSYHRFTAPVKGLYYFTLGILTTWGKSPGNANAEIMHGNVRLRYVYTNKNSRDGRQSATGSAAVMLNAGEQVWAKRAGGTLYSDSGLYTQFVGFLIQKIN